MLLLQQMCAKLQETHSQMISNAAWAISVLQHCHCWCMCECMPLLRLLFSHFAGLSDQVPRCVQNVLHCMVQVSGASVILLFFNIAGVSF
jgi:hypothetical protein